MVNRYAIWSKKYPIWYLLFTKSSYYFLLLFNIIFMYDFRICNGYTSITFPYKYILLPIFSYQWFSLLSVIFLFKEGLENGEIRHSPVRWCSRRINTFYFCIKGPWIYAIFLGKKLVFSLNWIRKRMFWELPEKSTTIGYGRIFHARITIKNKDF